ncbi:MAG: hypothetical protein Q4G22_09120 [Paracoccus sp. (in: a-proteobacteria)]|uniref:c-type cytochrome n=1 Tax=Paracoccus sp. TaxID=267 RepID=UPI0026DFD143|nr:c-type cytochrome [Paracoccus sp. (in: a-proteobacteria)]MDO5631986.1 hypothetical protein [Paracoccus sp. (in: a-proteobacteria)]
MRRKLTGILALCVLLPAGAAAQDLDRAAVQVLAGPCASCHGPDGHSPGAIPSIAGQPREQLQDRMLAFRSGSEPSTVMGRHMRGYDEAQIAALAQWFSEIGQ